ncbi:MAG TPA: beta-propeller fold lactonase family protein [Thermoanaerobaculia bacterium]|nr:beta-propeller fold lactonase family protein [Thermoanaerobaculia bacterium]
MVPSNLRQAFNGCVLGFLIAAAASAQVITSVDVFQDGFGGITGIKGPRAVVASPDGKNVYASGETGNGLAVFARDPITGNVTEIQSLFDGVGGVDGLMGAQVIAVSPDGKNVYLAGTFDQALAVFSRDPSTGMLTEIQVIKEVVDLPVGLASVIWATVSPDGKNVYTAAVGDGAVINWIRNPTTGTLTLHQLLVDGMGGHNNLGGAFCVAVSPNGKNVYVTGLIDGALTVFTRNPRTGDLTEVQTFNDGVAGIDGLGQARNVIVSRNSRQVYVTAIGDSSVSVWKRDKETGLLTQTQVVKDSQAGVDGLFQATGVAETPDGKYIITAAFGELRLGVFNRNVDTGLLTWNSVVINGTGNPGGLRQVISLSVWPADSTRPPGPGEVTPRHWNLYSVGFLNSTFNVWDIAGSPAFADGKGDGN